MTLLEAVQKVGKTGTLELIRGKDTLEIPVTVTDVKKSYGKFRWLVTPVGGSGTTWVEAVDV